MTDTINYGQMMHRAMRGLMIEVLEDVSENGLPGDHHFFITFETEYEGVEISDWLKDRYADEMTIVIQHWYQDFVVGQTGFTITLNFSDNPETLRIPFDAIKTFVDPSVEFGLRFEQVEEEDVDALEDLEDADFEEVEETETDTPQTGEVVSLDSFRKN